MYIGGSTAGGMQGMSREMMEKMRQSRENGESPEEFVASLVEEKDSDEDGLLSLDETGLDEDKFNSMDSDGDGQLSAEEISADMQRKMEQMRAMMGRVNMMMQGMGDPEEFAASLIQDKDEDGDGLLSMAESGLDEEVFNAVDSDGDGYHSTEEIVAHEQERMEQGGPMAGPPPGMEPGAEASGGLDSLVSGESSSDDDDEQYDELDLNKDGEVSMEELMMALRNGRTGMSDIFATSSDGTGDVSAMTLRMAMQAYQVQDA